MPQPPGAAPTIAAFELGPFATNTYVVGREGTDTCWIVDPSFDPAPLLKHLRTHDLRPVGIVLTHAHCDHVAGIPDVLRAYPGLPILLHDAERDWPGDPELNLSLFSGSPISVPGPTASLADGQTLDLAGCPWRILHTPGHSPGGVTLVHDDSRTALVGDTLFAGSIGRTDFPGSSHDQLARSIRERLYGLPDETTILPGHGPASTIGRERRTNPFVRG